MGIQKREGKASLGFLVRCRRFREMHEIAGRAKPCWFFFPCLLKEEIFAPELCMLEGWVRYGSERVLGILLYGKI